MGGGRLREVVANGGSTVGGLFPKIASRKNRSILFPKGTTVFLIPMKAVP